jgi:hypothetical protein
MKDLVKVLLLSAAMITSVSAGPKTPVPFVPPSIDIDLKNWEWMSIGMTGQFHVGVKYVSEGQVVDADYQAISQKGHWYHAVLRSYVLEPDDVVEK